MTTQIKRRRGTTTQHSSFTGAEGELTIDTTKDTVVVHDGTTSGGHPLAKESSLTGKVDKAGDTMTGDLALSGADVTFGDNDKAIFGGVTSELQIYSDGVHSRIVDAGTGNLNLQGDNLRLKTSDATGTYLEANNGGAVTITYNNSPKLATTSTGVDITGTLTSDGLTVDGDATLQTSDGTILTLGSTDSGVVSGDVYGSIHFDTADTSNTGTAARIEATASGSSAHGVLDFYTTYEGTQYNRMKINFNGDISFYEDTGTTAKLTWDASEEMLTTSGLTVDGVVSAASVSDTASDYSLLLDATAVAANYGHNIGFDTAGGVASAIITRDEGSTNKTGLGFATGDSSGISERLRVSYNGDISFYDSAGSSQSFFWDASAERLLLGTLTEGHSDADNLTISGDNRVGMTIRSANSGSSRIYFSDGTSGAAEYVGFITYDHSDNHMRFGSAADETFRIDAGNNLLVGTTDTSLYNNSDGSEGVRIAEDHVSIASNARTVFYVNRQTSDGEIINIRKDGTTVGSIGSASGVTTYIDGGSGYAGLQFGGDGVSEGRITPRRNGAGADAQTDLGTSSLRFKDLYLSGSIHGDVKFENNAGTTEYARFNSSGDLLVGKSVTSINTAGSRLIGGGSGAQFTADGTEALALNRLTSDGDLIWFGKAGAPVGSIFSSGGIQMGIGDNNTALLFADNIDAILPWDASANSQRDDAIDLGRSITRFKDLYLSGSIHGDVKFENNAGTTEYARFDSGGNLLVGKTVQSIGTDGVTIVNGQITATADGANAIRLNRKSSDGSIIDLRKDGTTVGSIGTENGTFWLAGNSTHDTGIRCYSVGIAPCDNAGVYKDNSRDLGSITVRWDDIYASNGTIQTSDRNEKQDIEALSDAEQRVAVAAKGLLRKFRWIDAVEEKGDEARTHFGIIAQDLQAAFAAEGLDAGDYAMFTSSTWTDEDTGEERTRMGVRYSELLAFIIAAI